MSRTMVKIGRTYAERLVRAHAFILSRYAAMCSSCTGCGSTHFVFGDVDCLTCDGRGWLPRRGWRMYAVYAGVHTRRLLTTEER